MSTDNVMESILVGSLVLKKSGYLPSVRPTSENVTWGPSFDVKFSFGTHKDLADGDTAISGIPSANNMANKFAEMFKDLNGQIIASIPQHAFKSDYKETALSRIRWHEFGAQSKQYEVSISTNPSWSVASKEFTWTLKVEELPTKMDPHANEDEWELL